MIKFKTLFFSLTVSSILLSCEDSVYDTNGLIGGYEFDFTDTIMSASEHTMTLTLRESSDIESSDIESSDIVRKWDITGSIHYWEGSLSEIPDGDLSQLNGWENHVPNIQANKKWTKIWTDWITIEQITVDGSQRLKITLAENHTDKVRAIRIYCGTPIYHGYQVGELRIAQLPAPSAETFTVSVRYKGQVHRSTAHLDLNENIVYDDDDFASFLNDLWQKPGMEMALLDNEIVDCYDNDDVEAKKALQALQAPVPASRKPVLRNDIPLTRSGETGFEQMATGALGYCALFDNDSFHGTSTCSNLSDFNASCDQQYMRSIGLNDKVTSLAVAYNGADADVCSVLTIWEDSYFNNGDNDRTKHRISIVASHNLPRVSRDNLRNVQCIGSSNSWNDRISSFSFHFGNYGHLLRDY